MKRFSWLAGLLMVTASCSTSPATTAIDLELYEFGITPSAVVFESGTVALSGTNTGEFGHTIVVTDATGAVVAASDLIAPGGEITLSVELGEGEYRISCRIVSLSPNGDLFDHYEQGMIADIRSP